MLKTDIEICQIEGKQKFFSGNCFPVRNFAVILLGILMLTSSVVNSAVLPRERILRGAEEYVVIGQIDDLKPEQRQESRSRVRDFFPVGAWITSHGHNGWICRKNVSFAPRGWPDLLCNNSSEVKLPDLEYPLSTKKLEGRYKIFFRIRMTARKSGILARLSGDKDFSLIQGELKNGKHVNCRVFWKEANLNKQNIILRHPHGFRTYIYGIELVSVKPGREPVEIRDLDKCSPGDAISCSQDYSFIESLLENAESQKYNTVFVERTLLKEIPKTVSGKIVYLLDKAAKNNLKLIVPEIVFSNPKKKRKNISREEIEKSCKDVLTEKIKKHPALLGYYLVDEPEVYTCDNLKRLNAIVREKDPVHPGISCFCRQGILGGTSRGRDNLRKLFKAMGPDALTCDFYPFRRVYYHEYLHEKELLDIFAQCIDEAVRQTDNANVPLWMVIQSFGSLAREIKTPTAAGLRAEVNLSIAHGAKGIFYFSFINSKIGKATGNIAKTRELTREITSLNAMLRTLSPILLRLKKVTNIISSPGDLDVQTHVDRANGDKYIFITNKNIKERRQGAMLIFTPGINGKIESIHDVVSGKKAKHKNISYWKKLKYDLAPGAGVIFQLQTAK